VATGGEMLVRSLKAHGVGVAFGIPGTHNLEIYRHLTRYGVRHVTPRHEQGAGYAADGYARTVGRPGVAITTTGPAALNIAAALAQAYSDSVPILVVATGPPVRDPWQGNGMLHEMRHQLGAMASTTEYAYRPASAADVTEVVARAFLGMMSGRPRPAYIEVPLDVLTDETDVSIMEPLAGGEPRLDAALVTAAARRLIEAERPGILVGGGARRASAEAVAVAERLGAPVLTTVNGKGIVPGDHPLSAGAALHLPGPAALVDECDVLLAVGTEFAETDWWYGAPRAGLLVRVDVDVAQLTMNVPADLGLHADARTALAALRDELPAGAAADRSRAAAWRERLTAEARAAAAPWVSTMDAIASVLDRDAIVVADNARAAYRGALGTLPIHTPGGFYFPTGFGTLGYALPAAFGAKVAAPDRQVVAIAGDGGLMFSVQEIASVAVEGVPLPIVVFDNGGYGEINDQMRKADIEPLAVDLPTPDLVGLARALGGEGVRCGGPDAVAAHLREALGRPGPTVLVVREA
jgi:thiamine pyrophosphate-dependent acetolactate synthase large subunit-like protein